MLEAPLETSGLLYILERIDSEKPKCRPLDRQTTDPRTGAAVGMPESSSSHNLTYPSIAS
jgi:hypothetical protein